MPPDVDGSRTRTRESAVNVRFYTDYPVCNFRCPYCIAGHAGDGRQDLDWDGARYLRIIDNLCRLDFEINVRIGVGGEFFASPVLIEGAQKLSHAQCVSGVNLITNLSFSLDRYRRVLEPFAMDRVALVASCHPTEIGDLDAWLDVAQGLARMCDLATMLVAYSPLVPILPSIKARIEDRGLECFVQPLIGDWEGRAYPSAYSPSEHAALCGMMYSRHDQSYLLDLKKPGLCTAGHRAFYVDPVGKAFPCGSGPWPDPMGDLNLSPILRLTEAPAPCPFQTCQCDTEIINILDFRENYQFSGLNQHKYRPR